MASSGTSILCSIPTFLGAPNFLRTVSPLELSFVGGCQRDGSRQSARFFRFLRPTTLCWQIDGDCQPCEQLVKRLHFCYFGRGLSCPYFDPSVVILFNSECPACVVRGECLM
jgi:hypothetical protein